MEKQPSRNPWQHETTTEMARAAQKIGHKKQNPKNDDLACIVERLRNNHKLG